MSKNVPGDDGGIEILEIVGMSDNEPEPVYPPVETKIPTKISKAREDGRMEGLRQVLRELLPALDDLESCVRRSADHKTMEEGVRLGLRELWDVFRVHGLERIEGTGMPFDPALHDAGLVTQTDRVQPNTVLEVLRVGYVLAGELARPALVRVSTPMDEEELIDERFRDPGRDDRTEGDR
ncbi:MAG: nucleotide exchange factor GrpE [Acidobacteriota bacterium]|nr:nucleotide exchange factor GrpE [Acidobacteriota bacterium]